MENQHSCWWQKNKQKTHRKEQVRLWLVRDVHPSGFSSVMTFCTFVFLCQGHFNIRYSNTQGVT